MHSTEISKQSSITSCNSAIAFATLFNQQLMYQRPHTSTTRMSLTHAHMWSIRLERVEHLSLGLIGGRLRLGLGLGLRRSERLLDGDGVDLRHVRRQRRVHQPVPLQQPLPLELLRHHLDLIARATPSHRRQRINQQRNRDPSFRWSVKTEDA